MQGTAAAAYIHTYIHAYIHTYIHTYNIHTYIAQWLLPHNRARKFTKSCAGNHTGHMP